MNILFVLENYAPHIGGVEILFKNLAEGLVKQGHDVDIVTHKLKETKKYEVINGVKIHRVRCFHTRYLFTFFSIPQVFKLSKEADVINATIFNSAFPAWVASKIRKKPCILTVTEVWRGLWNKLSGMGWFNAKIHDLLERVIYFFKYDHYACISQSTQKQLLSIGINKNKTSVIYPGINYDLFDQKKYSKEKIRKKLGLKGFIYMFYGRPGISKGLEYLIKAVPRVSEIIPNSKLLAIVSKDKTYTKGYNSILELIKKLKIQDKILLLDPVPYAELPNYLKASDCAVVPSLTEGFGFTAAESCAMNVPIVASNAGSLPEVVSGKYVLVEPANSEAIAKGVELVYRSKVKNKGKKIFRLDDNIEGYFKVYKKLIKKN